MTESKHDQETKAGEPVALPFAIFDDELKDLHRFHECVMDNEGYDVPKERMKRLAEIGLVRRCSGNLYEHTTFGLSVINGDFCLTPPDTEALREVIAKAVRNSVSHWPKGHDGAREEIEAHADQIERGEVEL